ncbi:SIP domain-containing protein [Leucobacter coleopterorum]|uniref:SIP domain-containing protein n=1 Tax=Leucobacter coleopterorum TaxID=2714933 RepID=A0ABX6K2X0_9MICO|nr:SIP domain-containing protein [Leucobacter coleopterorum]QIM19385.1 SIP domain-containing protein [Leucobacter coleopterorum]
MQAFESDGSEITSVVDPDGIDCVLAAGDAADLDEIREWLQLLPDTAYGQVFVEVSDRAQIEPLPLPVNVAATWLFVGGGDPGVALETAVDAWFDEWLWPDSGVDRNFHLWTGARENAVMQGYWHSFDRRLKKRLPRFCDPNCVRDCFGSSD